MTNLVFRGARDLAEQTESAAEALRMRQSDRSPESSDPAYYCHIIRALTGTDLCGSDGLSGCLKALRSLPEIPGAEDEVSRAGLSGLLYGELRLRILEDSGGREAGPVPDAVIRSLGVPLMTGDIPGIAMIMGSAESAAHVSVIARKYLEQGLIVFLSGKTAEEMSSFGLCTDRTDRFLMLGEHRSDMIRGISAIARIAEIFCGTEAGNGPRLIAAVREKIRTVLNWSGTPDGEDAVLLAGAAALGITVVTDTELSGFGLPGAVLYSGDAEELPVFSMERAHMKVKPGAVILPVGFDTAFEGEIVRDSQCAVEFPTACELVRMTSAKDISDHKITLLGRDISQGNHEKTVMHLAVCAEVCGDRMQRDFESVIERRIHNWLCYAEGVEHRGKRDRVCLRISRDSLNRGLKLADLAEMLYVSIRTEFEPVVDKCQITVITDADASDRFVEEIALPRYQERDERLASLTDENVDTYYTCTMCQSIAPHHCCVVTPERSGMCGAVTWPDARATYELSSTGPNRPVQKGEAADPRLGVFDAVSRAVEEATAGSTKRLSLYSMMDSPMTGCGRLECICGVEAVSGGIVIVDRDYNGMTPAGLSFEDMAEIVFGGVQNPGFMGIGRRYISSEKFIRADGGALRIVWMPRKLKEDVAVRLNRTVKKLYKIENFCDMICDETVTSDPEELYGFLSEKGHPVLEMEPIM